MEEEYINGGQLLVSKIAILCAGLTGMCAWFLVGFGEFQSLFPAIFLAIIIFIEFLAIIIFIELMLGG